MTTPNPTTLIVLAARRGDPAPPTTASLPRIDRVIAVDSGLHLARALDLEVDLVIGDLDSVNPELLAEAKADGTAIAVHPRDKDHTDLALGLADAVRAGAAEVIVIGGAGGRLDHGLANLLALTDPSLADCEVSAHLGGAVVWVVRDRPVAVHGEPGDLLSIIPVLPGTVVESSGLRWDLAGEQLPMAGTRGVSNELQGPNATVRARDGVALAIRPARNEALES